eukprot:TRINITY_DN20033_c0_g1_i3.p1 TRINITY_DN20033_c0_g1~~TRINITY_DN20033_c0_g1_i3.p1  ORF type:complete len:1657 (+),score=207.41 TRINITY_DN20033_c0_g1_i3:94-5064(+)
MEPAWGRGSAVVLCSATIIIAIAGWLLKQDETTVKAGVSEEDPTYAAESPVPELPRGLYEPAGKVFEESHPPSDLSDLRWLLYDGHAAPHVDTLGVVREAFGARPDNIVSVCFYLYCEKAVHYLNDNSNRALSDEFRSALLGGALLGNVEASAASQWLTAPGLRESAAALANATGGRLASKVDVAVCSFPGHNCLQLAAAGMPVVLRFSHRFDHWTRPAGLSALQPPEVEFFQVQWGWPQVAVGPFVRMLRQLARSPTAVISVTNAFDWVYLYHYTGIRAIPWPTTGTAAPSAEWDPSTTTEVPIIPGHRPQNRALAWLASDMQAYEEQNGLEWRVRYVAEYNPEDVLRWPCAVVLPYSLHAGMVVEAYAAGVPLLAPSLKLFGRLHAECGIVSHWTAQNMPRLRKDYLATDPECASAVARSGLPSPITSGAASVRRWLPFADVYRLPNVTFFDSVSDMYLRLGELLGTRADIRMRRSSSQRLYMRELRRHAAAAIGGAVRAAVSASRRGGKLGLQQNLESLAFCPADVRAPAADDVPTRRGCLGHSEPMPGPNPSGCPQGCSLCSADRVDRRAEVLGGRSSTTSGTGSSTTGQVTTSSTTGGATSGAAGGYAEPPPPSPPPCPPPPPGTKPLWGPPPPAKVAWPPPPPGPTMAPSEAPSQKPTDAHTTTFGAPTFSPSLQQQQPSFSPYVVNGFPSTPPSAPPTAANREPSASPSQPTVAPSHPTAAPKRPSAAPQQPAVTPTALTPPSAAPSFAPTGSPLVAPTKAPLSSPTYSPVLPTSGPTQPPSRAPSRGPSTPPTTLPSAAPLTPSAAPAKAPSAAPTSPPSRAAAPTAAPVEGPSASPSARPRAVLVLVLPTGGPRIPPTQSPTHIPTSAPTQGPGPPTAQPTQEPEVGPSSSPTVAPTSGPSNGPVAPPSAVPSAAPSVGGPSGSPTPGPSVSPTRSPSLHPNGISTQEAVHDGCSIAAVATVTSSVVAAVAGGGAGANSATSISRLSMMTSALDCPSSGPPVPLDMAVNPLRLSFGTGQSQYAQGTVVGNSLIIVAVSVCVAIGLLIEYRRWQLHSRRAARAGRPPPKRSLKSMLIRARIGWLVIPMTFVYSGVAVGSVMTLIEGGVGFRVIAVLDILIFLGGFCCYAGWAARRAPVSARFRVLPLTDAPVGWRWLVWGGSEWQAIDEDNSSYKFLAMHQLVFNGYRGVGVLHATMCMELAYTFAVAGVSSWRPASHAECQIQASLLAALPAVWGVYMACRRPYIAPYENAADATVALAEAAMCSLQAAATFDSPHSWEVLLSGKIGLAVVYTVTAKTVFDLVVFMYDTYDLWIQHGGRGGLLGFTKWFFFFMGRITKKCDAQCWPCRQALGEGDNPLTPETPAFDIPGTSTVGGDMEEELVTWGRELSHTVCSTEVYTPARIPQRIKSPSASEDSAQDRESAAGRPGHTAVGRGRDTSTGRRSVVRRPRGQSTIASPTRTASGMVAPTSPAAADPVQTPVIISVELGAAAPAGRGRRTGTPTSDRRARPSPRAGGPVGDPLVPATCGRPRSRSGADAAMHRGFSAELLGPPRSPSGPASPAPRPPRSRSPAAARSPSGTRSSGSSPVAPPPRFSPIAAVARAAPSPQAPEGSLAAGRPRGGTTAGGSSPARRARWESGTPRASPGV